MLNEKRMLPGRTDPKPSFDPYSLAFLDQEFDPDVDRSRPHTFKTTCVIGLGGKGFNDIEHLRTRLPPSIRLLRIDHDAESANGYGLWLVNKATGEEIRAEEPSETFADYMRQTSTLFLVGGLGGRVLAEYALSLAMRGKASEIPTFAAVSSPFCFEDKRFDLARQVGADLIKFTCGCLVQPNDWLRSYFGGEAKLVDAFTSQRQWLTHTLLTLHYLSHTSQLPNAQNSQSTGHQMHMGFGRGTGKERLLDSMKAAHDSPLLTEMPFEACHHAVVVLASGELPSTADAKHAEYICRRFLPQDCNIEVKRLADRRVSTDLYATLLLFTQALDL